MLRVAIMIFFSCMYSCVACSQNIDSLLASNASDSDKVTQFSNYILNVTERNADSGLFLAKRSLLIPLFSKGKPDNAHALNAIGWAYFRLGKYDSAKWYLSSAEKDFHARHNANAEARVLINLGNVSQIEQDYKTALNHLLAAMQLISSSDGSEYAVVEKMIGIIYRKQGDLINAKVYLKKASADFLRLKEQKYFADAYSSLGLVYLALAYADLSNLDSAAFCCHKALDIYLQQNSRTGAALANEDLGQIFYSKSDEKQGPLLDSSLYYFQQAYNIFCQMKDTQDMVFEKATISDVLIKKKQYPLAEKYLFEILPVFKSQHATSSIYSTLILLSTLYHDTHNYNKAYDYLIQANAYNDTLNQQNKDAAIADVLAKYETDKKDRTIALLNTQNALLNTKKQLAEHNLYKTRIIEIFSFILIILSVAFALVLLNRYRIKQKLLELQLRNHISNDLHDDVGSSLSSILLLSNIAAGSDSHMPELITKISENAREAIERISDIIWATNPKYDDGENLRSKIINYIAPLCQIHNIAFTLNIAEIIKNIKFPMEMRKNIFLIIKEALNNIFKHAGASQISLNLFLKDKKLVIEIADNGKGFNSNDPYNGNGLKNMRGRAVALGGEVLFDTIPGNGTRIFVTLPLSNIPSLTGNKQP